MLRSQIGATSAIINQHDMGRLTRQDKNWITEAVNSNTYFKRSVPVQGWCIPFADVLRRFVVKQYGEWREMFAVNKTAIRKTAYGRIEKLPFYFFLKVYRIVFFHRLPLINPDRLTDSAEYSFDLHSFVAANAAIAIPSN